MKKYLYIILAAVLTLAGCTKKAGKPADTPDEAAEEVGLYTDITGMTPDGAELSLSELIGKTDYVLLDFWASWCGPCRRFIPVLKEIYAGQPEGRLQIISCSVDQDLMAWQVALSEEQMPWPQMREDADHPCADKYGVRFIPHTVLIDRKGHIVAVNPEEPQMEEFLLGE